mmetsp:Transcript_364/g.682  ORF Transcript_364/g.682 Transcript_364/m.682 type:complete len:85 (-) Transcript_364:1954-2208(-)
MAGLQKSGAQAKLKSKLVPATNSFDRSEPGVFSKNTTIQLNVSEQDSKNTTNVLNFLGVQNEDQLRRSHEQHPSIEIQGLGSQN